MNGFERNKIFGAIFGALLAVTVVRVAARILFTTPPADPKAFVVADLDASAAKNGPGEKAPPEEPLPVLLAKADAARGEKYAHVCQACHFFQKGEGTRVGPDLYGVVGRPVASEAGFRYSQSMQEFSKKPGRSVWTFDQIFNFIKGPRAEVPGTAMSFPGMDDAQKRADVIVYLNTLGSNVALPPVPKEEPKKKTQKEEDKKGADENAEKKDAPAAPESHQAPSVAQPHGASHGHQPPQN